MIGFYKASMRIWPDRLSHKQVTEIVWNHFLVLVEQTLYFKNK